MFKHLIDMGPVSGIHVISGLRQQPDKFIHDLGDIIIVVDADLFPHLRGRGGDACDILKTAGSDHLHVFFFGIQIVDRVDQRGGDHMRKMAYSSCNEIMLLAGDDKWESQERIDHVIVFLNPLLRYIFLRCKNVVCILK